MPSPGSVADSWLTSAQRVSASSAQTTSFPRGGTRSLTSYSIELALFPFRLVSIHQLRESRLLDKLSIKKACNSGLLFSRNPATMPRKNSSLPQTTSHASCLPCPTYLPPPSTPTSHPLSITNAPLFSLPRRSIRLHRQRTRENGTPHRGPAPRLQFRREPRQGGRRDSLAGQEQGRLHVEDGGAEGGFRGEERVGASG